MLGAGVKPGTVPLAVEVSGVNGAAAGIGVDSLVLVVFSSGISRSCGQMVLDSPGITILDSTRPLESRKPICLPLLSPSAINPAILKDCPTVPVFVDSFSIGQVKL